MEKDLIVKTLHKVVDFLVKDSCEDVCTMCAYLGDFPPTPDDIEPCPYKRKNGTTACRNGIIEHFQTEIMRNECGKNTESN